MLTFCLDDLFYGPVYDEAIIHLPNQTAPGQAHFLLGGSPVPSAFSAMLMTTAPPKYAAEQIGRRIVIMLKANPDPNSDTPCKHCDNFITAL